MNEQSGMDLKQSMIICIQSLNYKTFWSGKLTVGVGNL